MSRNVCTNRSSIFLMSLEKKPIAVRPLLVSEFAGANAGAAFGVTGPLVERGRACAVPPRAELTAAVRLFRSAPRGALRDNLACPAGVAIQNPPIQPRSIGTFLLVLFGWSPVSLR